MNNNIVSPIQSIDRIFLIIEVLANYPKGASLTDICAETQLPKGTVSRMLSSLIFLGYAFQDMDNRKYCLTMRLFEIGSKVVGGTNILSIARPYLENLSSVSKEAVHLVSRVNDEVVYLYKEEASTTIARMTSCVGLRNPMYCTGVGKSILAFLPDEEIRAFWDRCTPVQFTPKTIMSFEQFNREVNDIRKNGYAIDDEEHEVGVCCIAAPILDFNSVPIAAISLSAPTEHFDRDTICQYAPLLLETAKNISRYYAS